MSEKKEIVFFCFQCGQKLAVSTKLQGKPLTCPACRGQLVVPAEDVHMRDAPPSEIVNALEITENDVSFNCEFCNWCVIIEKRGVGMLVTCPGCKQLITVPGAEEV